jgi:hypothetical protein
MPEESPPLVKSYPEEHFVDLESPASPKENQLEA